MHFLFQTRGAAVVFKDLISITFTQRSSAPRHQSGIWQCAKSSSRLRSPAYSRFIIPLPRRLMLYASPKPTSLFIILDDSCLAPRLKQHTENPRPPVSPRFGLRDLLRVPTSRYADSRVRRRIRPLIHSAITWVVYFAENARLS
jgi:hypothetical protein